MLLKLILFLVHKIHSGMFKKAHKGSFSSHPRIYHEFKFDMNEDWVKRNCEL